MKRQDLADPPTEVADLDQVADVDHAERQHQQSRGEVGQRVLQGQGHRHADGAEQGQQGRGLQAELLEHSDDDEDQDGGADRVDQERDDRTVHAAALQEAAQGADEEADGQPADEHHERGFDGIAGVGQHRLVSQTPPVVHVPVSAACGLATPGRSSPSLMVTLSRKRPGCKECYPRLLIQRREQTTSCPGAAAPGSSPARALSVAAATCRASGETRRVGKAASPPQG